MEMGALLNIVVTALLAVFLRKGVKTDTGSGGGSAAPAESYSYSYKGQGE
jgi:hypothetical protein